MTTIRIDPQFRGQVPQTQIEIDDEFRDLLPPLDDGSLNELLNSLRQEGTRDPLIAWEHDNKHILIDGHHRMGLCEANGLPYDVLVKTAKEIPDRRAAVAWIYENQLGRRNLTPEQYKLYLGKLYNTRKTAHGGNRKSSAQNEHLIGAGKTTAERLAEEHGVSAATVRRAGEFAEAVEQAKGEDPDIERKVIKGEVTRREVMARVEPSQKAQPRAEADAAPMLDDDGREIPKYLEAVFAQAARFQSFAQQVSTLKGQVRKEIEANPVAWSRFNENQFRSSMVQAFDLLKLSGPHIVCSYCGGVDSGNCDACKGTGFLTEAQARCVPPEFRFRNEKENTP